MPRRVATASLQRLEDARELRLWNLSTVGHKHHEFGPNSVNLHVDTPLCAVLQALATRFDSASRTRDSTRIQTGGSSAIAWRAHA
jgi:hypothetical protein